MTGVPVLLDAGALTIRRGRRTVLSGVALTVDPGRAIHVAGPNRSVGARSRDVVATPWQVPG